MDFINIIENECENADVVIDNSVIMREYTKTCNEYGRTVDFNTFKNGFVAGMKFQKDVMENEMTNSGRSCVTEMDSKQNKSNQDLKSNQDPCGVCGRCGYIPSDIDYERLSEKIAGNLFSLMKQKDNLHGFPG